MRVALIATAVAAVVAVPMGVSAAGPQMNSTEFLSAVRCVAYESAVAPDASDLGAARLRLNAEASKQPAEIAARAQHEAHAIAAASSSAIACASQNADGARHQNAV